MNNEVINGKIFVKIKNIKKNKFFIFLLLNFNFNSGKIELTNYHRNHLLEYLSKRPYHEVFTLIAMLVSLKPKTNGKKNDDVTSKI